MRTNRQKLSTKELEQEFSKVNNEIKEIRKKYNLGKRTGMQTAIRRFLRLHFNLSLNTTFNKRKRGKRYRFQRLIQCYIQEAYIMGRMVEKKKLWRPKNECLFKC